MLATAGQKLLIAQAARVLSHDPMARDQGSLVAAWDAFGHLAYAHFFNSR